MTPEKVRELSGGGELGKWKAREAIMDNNRKEKRERSENDENPKGFSVF